MKREQFYPKMEATPGSLQSAFVRCGRTTCHCAQGALHGPYWRRVWRQDGRTRKAYVPRDQVDGTLMAMALWRLQHPSMRALRRELGALRSVVE